MPDDDEPLGFMHENRHLRTALQAAPRRGRTSWLLWKSRVAALIAAIMASSSSLDDGRKLCAPLLVAADGRNSTTREAAGIKVARWKYDHQAIVSVSAMSGRTNISPMRSSIRRGPSRCCR